MNAALFRMEQARDVDEAQRLAPLTGIPHQNLVTADASGRIGWTIMGRIPRRVGFDGRLPVVVGRRLAALGRLARARGAAPDHGPGERPHLDGQLARGRGRQARRRGLRRLRPRGAPAPDPRRPAGDRQGERARHAADPARRPRAVPRALAEAAAGAAHARGRREGRAARRGPPPRRAVGRAGRHLLRRLPDRAGVQDPGVPRRAAAAGRCLRGGRPRLRLPRAPQDPGRPAVGRTALGAGQRASGAPARPALRPLGGPAARRRST